MLNLLRTASQFCPVDIIHIKINQYTICGKVCHLFKHRILCACLQYLIINDQQLGTKQRSCVADLFLVLQNNCINKGTIF
jgi:hypothetical protein